MDWEISVAELSKLKKNGAEFVLLDVREPMEVQMAQIAGSTIIPMGEVPARANNELDPDKHILVLCHHGARSLSVTAWLRRQGYDKVQSVAGGIDAWSREIESNRVPVLELQNTMATPAISFARENQPRFLEELKSLLRIPSISTLPEHAGDVRKAATFVADELKRIGMENVRLIETSGHPLVYADWLHAEGKPTVLCYGHFDVQPPDPLEEWLSPPFEPQERNGNLYARGAVDDKGQLWMHVKALESLFAANQGKLPLNIRMICEGEEEVGGEGIATYVSEHPEQLKADAALVSDTEMFAPELPTLCIGLRGMIYTEIEVRGAKTDLHSGIYGGVAPNPFVALAQIIAKLKNESGKILIPGFYDDLLPPDVDELNAWKALPFDEEEYRRNEVGSPVLTGEDGYSVLERTWARPTLDVHGMPGGFTGAGAKTVIPAKAMAKVSMRLVPDMTPAKAFEQYKSYVEKIAPAGVTVEVRLIHQGDAIVIGTDNPFVKTAVQAMREVWGKDTVFVRGGGSIPIVGDFERNLHLPVLLMGFGLPDDNLHAPNEKFHIANFYRGIESIIRFFEIAAS